jgi:hypothetical protein
MMGILLGSWGMAGMSLSQLGDLRYSRILPPRLSDVSTVGVRLELDTANPQMHISPILALIKFRLEQVGYTVVLPPASPSDELWLHVICKGISPEQASPPVSVNPLRLSARNTSSRPPPCHLAYTYRGEWMHWKTVDRFIYAEGISTMNTLVHQGRNPSEMICEFLHQYDFPILLATEWGHVNRIIQELNRPDASRTRQRLIMKMLGEIQDFKAFPILVEKLQDGKLAREGARALGNFGLRAQPHLLRVLQTASDPLLQAAAATGLGRIAATTGDSSPTPLFLDMISNPTIDIRVKTELVWALGKAPDFRAFSTLTQLSQTIWTVYSNEPQLQQLREAVEWSIREVKQGGHGDDY